MEQGYNKRIARFPDTASDHEVYDAGRRLIAERYAEERNYTRSARWIARIISSETLKKPCKILFIQPVYSTLQQNRNLLRQVSAFLHLV